MDLKLATRTRKCSAEFDVVWIRNAKDIDKYIAKRSTHRQNTHTNKYFALHFALVIAY